MREQLQQRLVELRAEFDSGQKLLAELDQKRANLEQTLLRISGAIQVLDELLAEEQAGTPALQPEQAGTPVPAPVQGNGRA